MRLPNVVASFLSRIYLSCFLSSVIAITGGVIGFDFRISRSSTNLLRKCFCRAYTVCFCQINWILQNACVIPASYVIKPELSLSASRRTRTKHGFGHCLSTQIGRITTSRRQSLMMTNTRCKYDISITIEHETRERIVFCRLTATRDCNATVMNNFWCSALSTTALDRRWSSGHPDLWKGNSLWWQSRSRRL